MYQGALCVHIIQTNQIVPIQGITIIPLQAYLVSCTRDATTDPNNPKFVYRVEKLSDGTVQTAESEVTGPVVQVNNVTWRLGAPNTHFMQYQGPIILAKTKNATYAAAAQAWLRNTYNGTTTTVEGETASEKASFFIEMDIAGD